MTIKAILDTNVIISGIFWKGAPFEILKAWQEHLWFAKTLADFEINDIAALPPLFCYNS